MKLTSNSIRIYKKYFGKKVKCTFIRESGQEYYFLTGIVCGYGGEFFIITSENGWSYLGADDGDFVHEKYIGENLCYIHQTTKIEIL